MDKIDVACYAVLTPDRSTKLAEAATVRLFVVWLINTKYPFPTYKKHRESSFHILTNRSFADIIAV